MQEELLRMKSGVPTESNGNYSSGWNARKSLSLLKMSLCRPAKLPVIDDDNDEEMEIVEDDREYLPEGRILTEKRHQENSSVREEKVSKNGDFGVGVDMVKNGDSLRGLKENVSEREEIDGNSRIVEPGFYLNPSDTSEVTKKRGILGDRSSRENSIPELNGLEKEEMTAKTGIFEQGLESVPTFDSSIDLHNPNLETLRTTENNAQEGSSLPPDLMKSKKSSTSRSLREFTQLEASLYNGLQILDNCSQKSPVGRSSVRFSFKPVDIKQLTSVVTNEVGVQTIASELGAEDSEYAVKCSNCTNKKSKKQLPKVCFSNLVVDFINFSLT